MSTNKRFSSPFEVKTPEAADGWQELYPYYMLFREKLQEQENSVFWFQDSLHFPRPILPFEAHLVDVATKAIGQYNTRTFMIPPAKGMNYRLLNGYLYMSPVAITDLNEIGERIPHFLERAGFYYQNWNELTNNWQQKVNSTISDLKALEFLSLPKMVSKERVLNASGLDETYDLIVNYDKLVQLSVKIWQYHFEFLNLGYAAYLDFFSFCKEVFPNIPDQAITKMIQGVEVDLFRPDEELKRLARLAVELDITEMLKMRSVEDALIVVQQVSAGQKWLREWETAKEPWFFFNSGSGFYSADKVWIDHLEIPFGYMLNYIADIEAGKDISRSLEALRTERDRVTDEYSSLLTSQEREIFHQKLELSRLVFPYVENHNFYVEHQFHALFFKKTRDLGEVFVKANIIVETNDIFYLRRDEIREAIYDLSSAWAIGVETYGNSYWRPKIERRKDIIGVLTNNPPPPALNTPPDVITDPFTLMLFGITTDRINGWLDASKLANTLHGIAASSGLVAGRVRIVHSPDELNQVRRDEILVVTVTTPSWVPVFSRIKGIVSDIGGIMSHAAIVCREYGIPAVTGTGTATKVLKTGQLIQVDGNTGIVTILED